DRTIVMISSTVLDLPAHREQVRDACLQQDCFPQIMENLPARDADPLAESLRLVDGAQVYLGIFAFRYGAGIFAYGYVDPPASHEVSLTEMEYDRAVERKIPRLIFFMHEDHPVRAADVETGPKAEKLKALKTRLAAENVVSFFKSPDD